jgi:hypothetical protein
VQLAVSVSVVLTDGDGGEASMAQTGVFAGGGGVVPPPPPLPCHSTAMPALGAAPALLRATTA